MLIIFINIIFIIIKNSSICIHYTYTCTQKKTTHSNMRRKNAIDGNDHEYFSRFFFFSFSRVYSFQKQLML
jgi:hypothetical protein